MVFPAAIFSSKFNFFSNTNTRYKWSGILILTIFNITDIIGRYLGDKIYISINKIIFLSFTRALLVISTTLIATHIWYFDAVNIVNLIVFAYSNWFLST